MNIKIVIERRVRVFVPRQITLFYAKLGKKQVDGDIQLPRIVFSSPKPKTKVH